MKKALSVFLSVVILLTQQSFAQTVEMTDTERALQRYEDLMLQFSVISDNYQLYTQEIEPFLKILYPNPVRETSIQKALEVAIETRRKEEYDKGYSRASVEYIAEGAVFRKAALKLMLADYLEARRQQLQDLATLRQTDPQTADEQLKILVARMDKWSRYDLDHPKTTGQWVGLIAGIVVGVVGIALTIPGLAAAFVGVVLMLPGVTSPIGMMLIMGGFVAALPGAGLAFGSYALVANLLSDQAGWNPYLDMVLERFNEVQKFIESLPADVQNLN